MALEDYLLTLVERQALPSEIGGPQTNRAEAVRKMLEFGDKYRLSRGSAITRADLHEEHRY